MVGNNTNTKLLLHANGGDGVKSAFAHVKCNDNAASTTVTDDGTGANTTTASTNTSNLSVTGKINQAFDFNGTTEYITCDALIADINTDTVGSFSFWVSPDVISSTFYAFMFGDTDANSNVWAIINADGSMEVMVRTSGTFPLRERTPASTFAAGSTWYHVVIVQDGVALKIYVDGTSLSLTQVGLGTSAWFSNPGTALDNGRICCRNHNGSGNVGFSDGQIDDFRYFQCALTSTEVGLLYDSGSGTENSIIVNSAINGGHTAVQTYGDAQLDTAVKKWGTGSLLFDGTGDYLSIPDSADWDVFGSTTDDQTVDFQLYPTSLTSTIYYIYHTESGSKRWGMYSSGGVLTYWIIDGGFSNAIYGTAQDSLTADQWQHIAICKSGMFTGSYVDGKQVGYMWQKNAWNFTGPLEIGGSSLYTHEVGNMDEVRVQADNYFSAAPNSFPAAPLLLYGEGTDEDTTMSNDGYSGAVTMTGGAKLDSGATKFNDTTSMFFDGTNDYITVVDTSGTDYDVVNSLTDSWTIDLWVKHTDHTGGESYVVQREDSSNYWALWQDNSNMRFQVNSGVITNFSMFGTRIADTSWHHVAMVKSANNFGLYLDGVQTAYVKSTQVDNFVSSVRLGMFNVADNPFDGNMEQVQITKGNKFGVVPIAEPYFQAKCNETTGTDVDDSGSGDNTLTASTNTSNLTITGKTGTGAFNFNGTSEYVDCDGVASDVSGDSVGAMSIWLRQATLAVGPAYSFGSDPGASFMYISSDANGAVNVTNRDSGVYQWTAKTANSVISANTWTHVVLVQDGVEPRVWVNGTEETLTFSVSTDKTSWMSLGTSFNTCRLGERYYAASHLYYTGDLDDARYYREALSESQIIWLYNNDSGTEDYQPSISVPTEVLTQDTITEPTEEYSEVLSNAFVQALIIT